MVDWGSIVMFEWSRVWDRDYGVEVEWGYGICESVKSFFNIYWNIIIIWKIRFWLVGGICYDNNYGSYYWIFF